MGGQQAIYRVETGMTKASNTALLQPIQNVLKSNEIALQKDYNPLVQRAEIESVNRQNEQLVANARKIQALNERQRQSVALSQHVLERGGGSRNPDNLVVLAITHNPTMMSLLESVCIAHDVQVETSVLIPEDKDFNLGIEQSDCGLVVVDLEVLSACQWRQKYLGCRLLRQLTEAYPGLPLLFIGTVSQKHAILAIRADTVWFLTQPINWKDLAHIVEDCDQVRKRRIQAGGG